MEFEMVEGRDIHQPLAGREDDRDMHERANSAPDDDWGHQRRAMHIPEQAY